MQDYARQQTAGLLLKLGHALATAGQKADADAIHDVRVAIRRLNRCLKIFAPFYPGHYSRKISQRLSDLMTLAGAARDCDIALELLREARVSPRAELTRQVAARRGKTGRAFEAEIRKWDRRRYLHRWKERLELP